MLVGVTAPLPRSTMKADRSHQLFPQRRLVLPHLSALLTPPILHSLQLDECPVDRLDLGLYAFMQAIEQLNQTLPPCPCTLLSTSGSSQSNSASIWAT
jgi:hypothetical protein